MTAKIISLAILSVVLSALSVYLFLQKQPIDVVLVTAAAAVTGWIGVVCRGHFSPWLQDRWNDDYDPNNVPVRIWLPVLVGGIVILGVVVVCALGL